ncbi:hypothetical protein STIUS_v1c04150 [Spiroplasma sp. TIUS-1]|uniref:hypothetical protein n=1 Tax=Spiroplasma sp. TIUS-1 TaxID=216963 RepID=UPI0013994351|nr:hypothetical protein [Spiroplasma sp. TIUS-1]QHX35969.1 hypothetical protein STIUS_v1c04150 [Spiroplasma sp. TIUS-1]
MANEQFNQYIDDFIKTNLEDESKKNKRHYLFFIFTSIGCVITVILAINASFDFEMYMPRFVFSVIFSVILFFVSIGSFKKFKRTTKHNTQIVLQNVGKFIEKYIELHYPDIKLQQYELKKFGGGVFWFELNENLTYYCDADIEEIVRYIKTSSKGETPIYYFVNTLSVTLNYKELPIEKEIKLKLGKTKGKDINNFISESIAFNKTYEVVGDKSDGFKFFTPVRIESLLNNSKIMDDIKFSIESKSTKFYRQWEITKSYKRKYNNNLASKPLGNNMSANDEKMREDIVRHISEVVEIPIHNLNIMKALLIHK